MKKRLCVFLALLAAIAARSSYAYELVTLPLPGIVGEYYGQYYVRYAHFEFEAVPYAINRVWIHVAGVFSVGETACNLTGTPGEPFPQGAELLASMKDTINGGRFNASSAFSESCTFEYTEELVHLYGLPATWDFLMAGYGNLSMNMNYALIPECWPTIYPEATIEAAELIIEGEFPVASDQSTWGSIKSLYR